MNVPVVRSAALFATASRPAARRLQLSNVREVAPIPALRNAPLRNRASVMERLPVSVRFGVTSTAASNSMPLCSVGGRLMFEKVGEK